MAQIASRPFSTSGGWKIPSPSDAREHRKGPPITKRIQVSILGKSEPLELCFKQRFTVSPGSVTNSNDKTGTWVWPSARAMVTRLKEDLDTLRRRQEKQSLRILELGAGCGFLGMVLAATGDEVLLTDHAGNIEWLRENVQLNKSVVGSRAMTAVLDWGDENHMAEVENEVGDEGFDAIVGSDLIYDGKCHHALVETMRRFAMPSPRAPVFLGYPDRHSSEPDFFRIAKEYFDVDTSHMGDDNSNLMYAVCQIRS